MKLESIMSGNYTGIENRISVLETEQIDYDGLQVKGHFYYLTFNSMEETLDEFSQLLYDQIVPFCIPKKKRDEAYQKFVADKKGGERHVVALADQAKKLFQQSNSQRKNSGEIGELILFLLQEHFLKAPQITCKMALKTNAAMPVHGADGIHIMWCSQKESLYFLWGESKLYKDPILAAKKTIESIKGFTHSNPDTGQNQRQREVEIIKDHPNINDPDLEKKLLKYFDPYEPESNQRHEAYSCFIGFEFNKHSSLSREDVEKHKNDFENKYQEEIKRIVKAFTKEVKGAKLEKSEFFFFLIPFKSISDLRKKFFEKLGFEPQEVEETDDGSVGDE